MIKIGEKFLSERHSEIISIFMKYLKEKIENYQKFK